MNVLAFISIVLDFLKAVVAPIMFWRGGRASARAESAERQLDRIEDMQGARRVDAANRKRLRRKFRAF